MNQNTVMQKMESDLKIMAHTIKEQGSSATTASSSVTSSSSSTSSSEDKDLGKMEAEIQSLNKRIKDMKKVSEMTISDNIRPTGPNSFSTFENYYYKGVIWHKWETGNRNKGCIIFENIDKFEI